MSEHRPYLEWSDGAAGPLLALLDADDSALAWQDDALCAETDPEAFYPEKGGSTREAKKVCMACGVRAECLEYALERDERFGIWGGLSERERRTVARERRKQEAAAAERAAILAAGEKLCAGCNEIKPLNGPHGFYPLRGWYEPQCKDCRRGAVAEWAKRSKAA